MKTIAKICLTVVLTVTISGCNFFEEIESQNLNETDRQITLADPAVYPAIIGSQFGELWNALHVSFPTMPISVAAQEISSSWGGWGMREMGTIPRKPLTNTEASAVGGAIEWVWFRVYAILAQTNDILRLVESGQNVIVDFDGDGTKENINDIVRGSGKLIQGMCLGHIALRYDKGFISDENSDPFALEFSTYSEIMAAAIEKLDEAIVLLNQNAFDVPADWINGLTWTNTEMAQFANSYAARLLAGASRNQAENAVADWARILNYTNAGLPVDYAPHGDGGYLWWTRILIHGQDPLRTRVSQRVITEMAIPADRCPTCPGAYPWPDGYESLPPLSPGHDDRIVTDMTYSGPPAFDPNRGYYFFSSYTYSRYASYPLNGFIGPMLEYSTVERDTYMAEALIRTGGSKIQAAALINNTRVNRGGLPALTGSESDQEMLDALFYERRAEIGWTWAPVIFYDRRRNDDLEPGTFKHMPVPIKELNSLGIESYTFGGLGKEM